MGGKEETSGTWALPFPFHCEANDVIQDEQHVFFHCTHPQMVSLRRKYA